MKHNQFQVTLIKICEELLANGADPNLKNKIGEAPLHTAARNGFKEVFKLLIDKGDLT